jgi:hypothetical protein
MTCRSDRNAILKEPPGEGAPPPGGSLTENYSKILKTARTAIRPKTGRSRAALREMAESV